MQLTSKFVSKSKVTKVLLWYKISCLYTAILSFLNAHRNVECILFELRFNPYPANVENRVI
jgi:hypothetical protein